MKKHPEYNRWYKIGFDEGRLFGNEFDPPREKPQALKDAYKAGFDDARRLG